MKHQIIAADEYRRLEQEIERLRSERDELLAACKAAVQAINGLADQQAMPDQWYEKPLAEIEAAIARAGGGGRNMKKPRIVKDDPPLSLQVKLGSIAGGGTSGGCCPFGAGCGT